MCCVSSGLVRVRLFVAALIAGLSAQLAQAEPAMWSLSDSDTKIYLLGTIHMLPDATDWMSPDIAAAFAAADTLCVETDTMNKAVETLQLTIEKGSYSGGERLSDHLSPVDKRRLFDYARAMNVEPEVIDGQKPWRAIMTLNRAMVSKVGMLETSSVEKALLTEAQQRGMGICEMETPETHINALAELPFSVQIAALIDVMHAERSPRRTLKRTRRTMNSLIKDWLAGDIDALEGKISVFPDQPELYQALIVTRNQQWTERIRQLMNQPGTIFIAVGAAHLTGPDSLVMLLRDAGYDVQGPLPPSTESQPVQ